MDQLDPVSVEELESGPPKAMRETPAQRHSHLPNSASPAVSPGAEVSSRKRKRPSLPPDPKTDPDPPSRLPTEDRASELLSQTSRSSKTFKMDCVLITTLPRTYKRAAPPETSEGEDDGSQARTRTRGREKQRGKQREVTSTSRASLRDSQSLGSIRSRSHSVSSLRRPLFDPVGTDPL
jgi:hypothetical protein